MPRPSKPRAVTTDDLIERRLLYPIAEAARLLGMHRTSVYNRAAEGKITLLRLGGRTYVTAEEVARFIADAERIDVRLPSRRQSA